MREPVPDRVAQAFLKHFLVALTQGKDLYPAVREARERLQGLEAQYPCATWLPIICQEIRDDHEQINNPKNLETGDRHRKPEPITSALVHHGNYN